MDVFFLHGLESGPVGAKSEAIRKAGWRITAPDCIGIMDVDRRVAVARRGLAQLDGPVLIVGSSFGGLAAALLYAAEAGSAATANVSGMLLLAPALQNPAAEHVDRCHPNTVILHGAHDDVVPVEGSRAFAQRLGCRLVEVDDGHRLADSHGEMLRLLDELAGR
jgi:alpha-beta hydrolase superfamily lysophospholipase